MTEHVDAEASITLDLPPDRTESTGTCPNCGAPVGSSSACADCGFQLSAADSVPLWEQERWILWARADRSWFDSVEPEGLSFPERSQSRRIPLLGDQVRIGRRSTKKGIEPDIDLSGALEDIGVSHQHAVLMRQPAGDWALVDEDSTNGTFVNDGTDPLPAQVRIPLHDGDEIHVGAWTTLTVEREEVLDRADRDDEAPSRDTRALARGRTSFSIDLLGPLEVTVAGNRASAGAPQQRAVLALLALRIGASVSATELEWAIWGDEEPTTAGKALQGYIMALRRLVPAGSIETTTGGYRLVGPREAIDVFRFERRCARGRELLKSGHPGAAVAELGRALDLWRGDPLPDLAGGPLGAIETPRLFEMRSNAQEDLFEGRLQLGDHQDVVADLTLAVENEPLRERRWGQLMLALHRSGRQVESLRRFQQLSEIFGDEYGIEPSAELVALDRSIALGDPELRWAPQP